MRHHFLFMALIAAVSVSCSRVDIIPKETMVDIYHDMYLLDQWILRHHDFMGITDTLRIYEPIFEKYGYTFEDYTASVNLYLERPEKFGKVFSEVRQRYETRLREMEDSLTEDIRRAYRWPLLDSVRTLGHDSTLTTAYYRALDMMFFTKDTTLLKGYPQPDSAALASYRLTVFELYEGDPFSTAPVPDRRLVTVPDTTSPPRTDTLKNKAAEERKTVRKRNMIRSLGTKGRGGQKQLESF